ncbi:hypothetical protein ACFOUV_11945 [Oceanobacillus longus]|uniref:Uncharacterized protein n=1 Tax=Oceanobacillus longus TaxID=930120 RepID=A0ABV8H0F2_9BACI
MAEVHERNAKVHRIKAEVHKRYAEVHKFGRADVHDVEQKERLKFKKLIDLQEFIDWYRIL